MKSTLVPFHLRIKSFKYADAAPTSRAGIVSHACTLSPSLLLEWLVAGQAELCREHECIPDRGGGQVTVHLLTVPDHPRECLEVDLRVESEGRGKSTVKRQEPRGKRQ